MAKTQPHGEDFAATFSKIAFNHSLLSGKAICIRFLNQFGISKDWARVSLREMQCLLKEYPDERLFDAARALAQPKEDPFEAVIRDWLSDSAKRAQLMALLAAQVKPASREETLRDLRSIAGEAPKRPRRAFAGCPQCVCAAR